MRITLAPTSAEQETRLAGRGVSQSRADELAARIGALGLGSDTEGWQRLWRMSFHEEARLSASISPLPREPKLHFMGFPTPLRRKARAAAWGGVEMAFAPIAALAPQRPARAFDGLMNRWATLMSPTDSVGLSLTHRNAPVVRVSLAPDINNASVLMMLASHEPEGSARFEAAARSVVAHELAHARFERLLLEQPQTLLAALPDDPYFKLVAQGHIEERLRTPWDRFQPEALSRVLLGGAMAATCYALGSGSAHSMINAGAAYVYGNMIASALGTVLNPLRIPTRDLAMKNFEECFADSLAILSGFKAGALVGQARLSGFMSLREVAPPAPGASQSFPGFYQMMPGLRWLQEQVKKPEILERALRDAPGMQALALRASAVSAQAWLNQAREVSDESRFSENMRIALRPAVKDEPKQSPEDEGAGMAPSAPNLESFEERLSKFGDRSRDTPTLASAVSAKKGVAP